MQFLMTSLRRTLLTSVVFGSILYFILATQLGLNASLSIAKLFVPGHLQIRKAAGNWMSGVELKNIKYKNADIRFSTQKLSIDWTPHFFSKTVEVKKFVAEKVSIDVNAQSSSKPSNNNSIPTLAWLASFQVQDLTLKSVTWLQEHRSIAKIDELKLRSEQKGQHTLYAKMLEGTVTGKIILDAKQNAWDIVLNGSELNPGQFNKKWIGKINFALTTKGIWNDKDRELTLNLQELSGTLRNYPVHGQSTIVYKNDDLIIDQSKINIANASATFSGNLNQRWNMQWDLRVPQFNEILPNSSGTMMSSGKITGEKQHPQLDATVKADHLVIDPIKFGKLNGILTVNVAAKTAEWNITGNDLSYDEYKIPQLSLQLNTQVLGNDIKNVMVLKTVAGQELSGSLLLPNFKQWNDTDQPIRGKFNYHVNEIAGLMTLPEVKNLSGQINGTTTIGGTFAAPTFDLDASINNGGAFIPKLGIQLKTINIKSTAQSGQPIYFSGQFASGKGQGDVEGTYDWKNSIEPLNIKIRGNELELAHLSEYKITASPDLQIAYGAQQAKIVGKLFIPQAKIAPKDFSSIVTLPSEVVIVDQKQMPQSSFPTNLQMQLQVTLGDQIKIAYDSLRARLKGNVTLLQQPGTLPTATGELYAVDGEYKAYGTDLKIQKGRLIYTGNMLSNPGLDIRAAKKIKVAEFNQSQFTSTQQESSFYTGTNDITIGIWVRGTMNKPQISFYSDPAGMRQEDILSYLVFGYPQNRIKDANKLALLSTALSSWNKDGDAAGIGKTTKKIQKSLGLSEFGLGSTEYFDMDKNKTSNVTTFNVGKKIGKRLSLHYSVGLFQSFSIFNIRYQISKRFAIQSETSPNDNGADLVYQIERD